MDIDLAELAHSCITDTSDSDERLMALRALYDLTQIARILGASEADMSLAVETACFAKLPIRQAAIGRSAFSYHAMMHCFDDADLREFGYNEIRLADEPSGREALRRSIEFTRALHANPVRGDHNTPGANYE